MLDKGKNKILKTYIVQQLKPQNHQAIKNFQKIVDDYFGNEKTYLIQLPFSLFGVEFRTYISMSTVDFRPKTRYSIG